MKRFVDTEIMVRPWFRSLDPRLKCLWLWMITRCDMSGFLDMDWKLASFVIGATVREDDLKSMAGNAVLIGKSKIFLPGFIGFQYGELNSASRVHQGVLKCLTSHGMKYPIDTLSNSIDTLSNPFDSLSGEADRLKDKDKDKDKGKDKGISCAEIPAALQAVEGFADIWPRWIESRKALKKPPTPHAQELMLKTLAEHPEHSVAAVEKCVLSGWQGFAWPWFFKDGDKARRVERNAKASGYYDSGEAEPWPDDYGAEGAKG